MVGASAVLATVSPSSSPVIDSPITVAIIDDNRLLRQGMRTVLMKHAGYQVSCAAEGVESVLDELVRNPPHVVLLDFGLANENSMLACMRLRLAVPTTRVIIMGVSALQEDVAAFIRAGAVGFVMKEATLDELLETIRMVAIGEESLPRALTHSLFAQIMRDEGADNREALEEGIRLTTREREIMGLLGDGLSNKEIAARLHIAVHTVKSHVHNILEKLSLHSRLEIAAYSRTGGPRHDR